MQYESNVSRYTFSLKMMKFVTWTDVEFVKHELGILGINRDTFGMSGTSPRYPSVRFLGKR